MGNFNRDRGGRSNDRRGGGGGFGRRDSRGGSGRPEMHRATCAECGASCEVPFKPTGDKPVYCSNCFRGKEDSAPRRSSGRDFGRSGSRDREMFKAVCAECGRDCEIPFKPTTDRPILCSSCFGGNSRSQDKKSDRGANQFEAQFRAINDKLDKILQSLSPKVSKEVVSKKEVRKPEVKKKTVVAKKTIVKKVKKSKK